MQGRSEKFSKMLNKSSGQIVARLCFIILPFNQDFIANLGGEGWPQGKGGD